jgi:exopolyphosphatase/guanosine-5'-triphosphate,3'-diphosphate pyrophosphatase
MIIGEMGEGGDPRILVDLIRFARLGEGGSATGKLSQKAEERTLAAIGELLELANRHQVDKLRLVGTSALREASNRAEFLSRVRREFGVDLEVLTEEDEARFSYSAVALDPSFRKFQAQLCVVDIGGGSTELIFRERGKVTFWQSLRLGAVGLTEQVLRSDPPGRAELEEAGRKAEEMLHEAIAGRRASWLTGVGGTVVSLARMWKGVPSAKTGEVHGVPMTPSDCRQVLDRLSSLSVAQRKTLVGLDPDRADIILAGAIILEQILSVLRAEQLLVSIRGLRHGVLYELLEI